MRTTKTTFIAALACVMMLGCTPQPKTTIEKIDDLKKQVTADANALQILADEDFTKLEKDFRHCDSLLQYLDTETVEAQFDQLNLTQAYLLQFKDVKPVMEHKMDYVVQQLGNLKSDAESHYLSDSLVVVYLGTERKVADTLHAQVEYFKDKFHSCQKTLNQLKKSK